MVDQTSDPDLNIGEVQTHLITSSNVYTLLPVSDIFKMIPALTQGSDSQDIKGYCEQIEKLGSVELENTNEINVQIQLGI